ncbi:MAG TPA: TetR/AcrR family transcriptional regulator [Leptolyngbyaceae cyanobacterium M33_DOE_097]|uniref:TetR/AcrR family transcriptional regulator n=1 Tax=Oscillatoriales cyanobacterium SpSt-418 TaxID=2282169 RepID=A0A7C3KDD4_9CYAN|nr:TetR/AcrR family transcriptional regulator [Leptolyngbyaceae cyanobacterium M33_DOE_097]
MKGKTAEQILDVAQDLVRRLGYSAFSYADISDQIGIRKASIHYHFPAKDELVKALVQRYRVLFQQQRQQIEQATSDPEQQLLRFAQLYQVGLQNNQLCLCNMLTADFAVLPDAIRQELKAFFAENETWLAKVLSKWILSGTAYSQVPVEVLAAQLLATLQGAQLLARASDASEERFSQIMTSFLGQLKREP